MNATDITIAQIEALSTEAAEAGDMAMVGICDDALWGDEAALEIVSDAIRSAEAMDDGEE